MIKFITQLICSHNYKKDEPNEIYPIPKDGEMINFIRPHTCNKCGKKINIGSGWMT